MLYSNLRSERGAVFVKYVLLVAIGGLTAFALFTSLGDGLRSKVQWMIDVIRNAGS